MLPSQLNHYRILEPLGKGGMGEVFAAEDTRLQRKVALKVLSGVMAGDPERRTRFEREARAVAALNHPNIVTIHSVEESDGLTFLTMELVEGVPLSSLVTGVGLPVDTLLRIALGISDAMSAAHQRGITHRDLKPGNVMVTPDGRVKVLDFGLAKLQEGTIDGEGVTHAASQDLTGEGRVIGTVAYMSPEQAEGKAVDQRSDIFSLGVMLHEMATGERPFKGDSHISVMSSILRDTPSSVTEINPKMPAGLARIVRRALAKDPTRRYQTATDLRNDLEDLSQELGSATSTSAARPPMAPAPSNRSRTAKVSWALVALVFIGGAGLALWWAFGRGTPAAPPEFTLDQVSRLTDGGNAQLAAISPDGRYVVHIKNADGKSSLWIRQTATASDVQIVAPDEVRYDGLLFSPDGNFIYYTAYGRLGGTAYLYRIPVLGGVGQKLVDDIDSRITFSPDASQFAFIRGDPAGGRSYLMTANADGTNLQTLSSMTDAEVFQLNAPAWSPDGATILASVHALKDLPHQAIAAVDVRTKTARVVGGRWGVTSDVEWMPDGRSFLTAAIDTGGPQQIWQIMFPSGDRRRVTNDVNIYEGVSVSRDGAAIASVQVESTANIWIVDLANPSRPVQITSGGSRADGTNGMTWTTANRLFFVGRATGRPQVWSMDVDGGNPRPLTNDPTPPLFLSAAADGRFAVFQSPQANGMIVRRIAGDGGSAENLTRDGSEMLPLVSPDGRWVYYTSLVAGYPSPYRIPSSGGQAVALASTFFRALGVSPDGGQLVGLGWDAEARRSSYATLPTAGGAPVLLKVPVTGQAAFSPDGAGIVHVASQNGVSNIVRRTPDGKVRPLTQFTSDTIYAFAWSPDGKRLAVSRGPVTSDVVLLTRAPAR